MPMCCVRGCHNRGGVRFPRDHQLREKWIEAVRREKNFVLKPWTIVCWDHFHQDDISLEGYSTGLPLAKRILKKGTVPSVFFWKEDEPCVHQAPEIPSPVLIAGVDCSLSREASNSGSNDDSTLKGTLTKRYACSVCDYKTRYGSHLKRHLKTHKDVGPAVSVKEEPNGSDQGLIFGHPLNDLRPSSTHSESQLNHAEVMGTTNSLHGGTSPVFPKDELIIKTEPMASDEEMTIDDSEDDLTTSSSFASQTHLLGVKDETNSCQGVELGAKIKEEPDHELIVGYPMNDLGNSSISSASQANNGELIDDTNELNGEKPNTCERCDYKSAQPAELGKHTRTHVGKKPYTCDWCDYSSAELRNLKRHVRVHTGEKPYACSSCDYKGATPCHLKRHMWNHTGERPYSCSSCDFRAPDLYQLKLHVRTHTGEKPYTCKICDYRAAQAGALRTHMRIHTGEKPFACTSCDYKAADQGSLIKHMRCHTGEKRYACNSCDYKAADHRCLKKHVRVHTGERPYACDTCDYRATQLGSLKIHMRTHSGEKPYVCGRCEFRAADPGSLKKHVRTHTGEKPYPCEICDYKGANLCHLKRHMLTHTGEKPYACDSCDFRAADQRCLKRHLTTHTGTT